MDLLVVAVALRLAVGRGRRGAAWTLLLAGIVVLFVTDAVHGVLRLSSGYEVGGVLDGGWLLSYALLGAAALHDSMRGLSDPAPAQTRGSRGGAWRCSEPRRCWHPALRSCARCSTSRWTSR